MNTEYNTEQNTINCDYDYEIVVLDEYRGIPFAVVNYFDYPCAYIRSPFSVVDIDDPILRKYHNYVNGGITFADEVVWDSTDSIWLGWDYYHIDDYSSFNKKGHKWTPEETLSEVFRLINAIIDD